MLALCGDRFSSLRSFSLRFSFLFRRHMTLGAAAPSHIQSNKILFGQSITAVVESDCSPPKPNNSDVLQRSALSPTLFILFINYLSSINCPIHSYADNTTPHFPTSFNKHQNQQVLQTSMNDAAENINSKPFLSFPTAAEKKKLVSLNASKT